jgi:threonine/homoserine/homoserine lactone efflux protein
VLGTIVNLAFSSADLVTVMLASALMTRLKRSQRAQTVLRWLGGSVLVGLGTHMATSRN